MNSKLLKRFDEIEQLAVKMGLDFFPIIYEEVPREVIWEVASYGLPTRMSHWSFGKSYLHQKTSGEMGHGKIYELIINNDPSYAFLDDTNTDVVNMLICAHCCYVPGTYVQTIAGLKKIEDVVAGDKVYNWYGNLAKVASPTSRKYRGKVVAIQAGGNKFTQTADHRLLAVKGLKDSRYKHRSWKAAFAAIEPSRLWTRADELSVGDFLVVNKPKNIGIGSLRSVSIAIKKTLHRKGIDETLNIPLNEEFGEFVGLYLAEGYAAKAGQMGLCFHAAETELHSRAALLVRKYLGLKTYDEVSSETNSHQVRFNEICIANFLRGALGTKCYEKKLPQAWMTGGSKGFLRGVLRGYLNGDGDKRAARSMGYSTTSPLLATQMQDIAMSNGAFIGVSARDRSTKKQQRRMAFVGRASGIHDAKIRAILGMPARKCSRTWSGVIEHGDHFYVKINSIRSRDYNGRVHCLNVPDGSSFTLANGVITHNCGHSHYFKNNMLFQKTNRNMVNQAEANAKTIEAYKGKYGVDTVEEWMDIAFALDRHIDSSLGEDRPRYPDPEHVFREVHPLPFADLMGESTKPHMVEEIRNKAFPPHPEKDLLWFLATYANLLPWQRDVLSIIRSEAYYFNPMAVTQIADEGFASFWHAELMLNYDLTDEEHWDFCRYHSGVVSPGRPGNVNPYYMGFKILTDIKQRWDKFYAEGQKDQAFLRGPMDEMCDEDGKVVMSKRNGYQKLFQVCSEDDDISLVGNYLTQDLAEEMELFTFGQRGRTDNPAEDDLILKDRGLQKIKDAMTSRMHNNGAPNIYIERIEDKGVMHLRHDKREGVPLDEKYTKETLKYIYNVWRKPVVLITYDRFMGELKYTCGEQGATKQSKKDGETIRIQIEM